MDNKPSWYDQPADRHTRRDNILCSKCLMLMLWLDESDEGHLVCTNGECPMHAARVTVGSVINREPLPGDVEQSQNRAQALMLSERASACPHWLWMAGMLVQYAGNEFRLQHFRPKASVPKRWRVVLDDPATRGCLVALVREAWDAPFAHTIPFPPGKWHVDPARGDEAYAGIGSTEDEALVHALERAPANA